jgi:hypothetical protein
MDYKYRVIKADTPQLDIRYLRKSGFLTEGLSYNLCWTANGKQIFTVSVRLESNFFTVCYGSNEEHIWHDRTACNYGNHRSWFLCSLCGRRVAILHHGLSGFLCRHCYDLAYASQREPQRARMMRKARKIRNRLGASMNLLAPIVGKPKGMHWDTYRRLVRAENKSSNLAFGALTHNLCAGNV